MLAIWSASVSPWQNSDAIGGVFHKAQRGAMHVFSILVWALWLRHLSDCFRVVAPTVYGEEVQKVCAQRHGKQQQITRTEQQQNNNNSQSYKINIISIYDIIIEQI